MLVHQAHEERLGDLKHVQAHHQAIWLGNATLSRLHDDQLSRLLGCGLDGGLHVVTDDQFDLVVRRGKCTQAPLEAAIPVYTQLLLCGHHLRERLGEALFFFEAVLDDENVKLSWHPPSISHDWALRMGGI